MSVTVIVAQSSNGVIGRNGQIPWHLPSDLRRFKDLTMGHTVIMGRQTYESLPDSVRPLPGRTNIVLSRTMSPAQNECVVARSLPLAIEQADGDDSIFIIGGSEVYRQALGFADRVIMTLVEDHISGDTYFPRLGPEWIEVSRTSLMFETDLHFRYLEYERISGEPVLPGECS